MKKLLVFLSLLVSLSLYGGRIHRAFEALEIYDYFKAKKLFEKCIKTDPVTAYYGLSLIYSNDKNPFYNLNSAYETVLVAEEIFGLMPKRYQKALDKEFSINGHIIDAQKQKILGFMLDNIAKQGGSIESYESFIVKYKKNDHTLKAEQILDSLYFDLAKQKHTWLAYHNFLSIRPNAKQSEEALDLYQRLIFEEKTKDGKAESIAEFNKEFPDNPYGQQARTKIFSLKVQNNRYSELAEFVKKFPNDPNVDKAWQALFTQYFYEFTPRLIKSFNRDFPKNPLKQKIEEYTKASKEKYFIVSKNSLYGFISENLRQISSPSWDFVDSFSYCLALVGKGGKVGYIDVMGELVIPLEYDDGGDFIDVVAPVLKGDYWGVINRIDGEVLPFEFDDISLSDKSQYILTTKDGTKRFYTKGGKARFKAYAEATQFDGRWAVVEDHEGNVMILSSSGEETAKGKFQEIKRIENSYYFIAKNSNDKYFIINDKGIILSKQYDKIGDFYYGLAYVINGQKYGYIDLNGKEVLPVKFPVMNFMFRADFKNLRALTEVNSKVSLIDKTGKNILGKTFEDIVPSTEFPIAAKKGNLWGYVDKNGDFIIKPSYTRAFEFNNSKAIVVKKNLWGIINNKNDVVVPLAYSGIEPFTDSLYISFKNGKAGLISSSGNVLLNNNYDRINAYIFDNIIQILDKDKIYYYDTEAKKFIIK